MNRAGNESAVATGVAHPLEIPPGENTASRQQPDPGKATPQRLEHPEIDSTSRSNPTEIEQKQRRDSGRGCLVRQTQRIGADDDDVLQRGMKDWSAELEVETEHHSRGANDFHNARQVRKGMERLQAHYHLAGTTGQDLQCASRLVRAGVHHQRTGKAGVELSQLPQQRSLEGATLDRIEIGHVALMNPERGVEGAEQRYGIARILGHQT